MEVSIIISILLIGVVCFWAGHKIGLNAQSKAVKSVLDSWKANYTFTSINHKDNLSNHIMNSEYDEWDSTSTFSKDNYFYSICKDSRKTIEDKMNKALELEDYEKAAKYRDILKNIKKSGGCSK